MSTQKRDSKTILLQSFHHPTEINHCFTIVEACLATSAAPHTFASLVKVENGMTEMFIGGGSGFNKPVLLIAAESYDMFRDQKINALISVGTGAKRARPVDNNLVSLAKRVAKMATDATREAEIFSTVIAATDPDLYDAYFRFHTNAGLSTIPLQDRRMLAIISHRTRTWLSQSSCKLKL